MKRIIIVLFSVVLLTGCGTLLTNRTPELLRPASTNIVQLVVTNTVEREVWKTNRVELPGGGMALQPVQSFIAERVLQTNNIVMIQPSVWYTNVSVSPTVTGAIQTAGDLAPVPWGGLAGQGIAAIIGIVAAGYNWFGKRKALKDAGVAQSTADTMQSAVKAGVLGFEHLRKVALHTPGYTPVIDDQVMRVVQGIQVAAGVKPIIAGMVEENTGETTS